MNHIIKFLNFFTHFLRLIADIVEVIFTAAVNILFIKHKKVWVFYSSNGKQLEGNSYHLFQHLKWKWSNIKLIFIVSERNLSNHSEWIYYYLSMRWIYYQIFSQVKFLNDLFNSYQLLWLIFPRKSLYFQLYHGIPLKVYRFDKFSQFKKLLMSQIKTYIRRDYDYFLVTSDNVRYMFDNFFQNNLSNNYISLGYPRNDLLFSWKKWKIILYAPTFRPYAEKNIFSDVDTLKKIDYELQTNNYILYIKLHDRGVGGLDFSNFKNIKKYNNVDSDFYEFLWTVSILITDYSSIYFDFLLLDRPIVYFPYDFETYKTEVGFTVDYNAYTPWMKIYSWNDLLKHFSWIIHADEYKVERLKLKNIIHAYQDGNSSDRIYNFVINNSQ